MELFRHCPECGRRFHIRLEDQRLVHYEKKKVTPKKPAKRSGGIARAGTVPGNLGTGAIYLASGYMAPASVPVLFEGKPFILETKEFQYKYKCGHCGHQWTEHHREDTKNTN